jgi:hypothetical protein
MKRILFLTLSISYIIACIAFSIYIGNNLAASHIKEFGYDVHSLWTLIGASIGSLVVCAALTGLTALFAIGEDLVLFTIGFISYFRNKKVYHSDLGVFYINISTEYNRITVYSQGILYQSELFYVDYDGNIEQSSAHIKSILDNMYKAKLEKIRLKDIAKNWDGCLDKTSKRDKTLNQII